MDWRVIFQVASLILLGATIALAVPVALEGSTIKSVAFVLAVLSGGVVALAAVKLRSADKSMSVADANRLNSHQAQYSDGQGDESGHD